MNKPVTVLAIVGVVAAVSLAGVYTPPNGEGLVTRTRTCTCNFDCNNINMTVNVGDIEYTMNDYWSVHVIQPNGDEIYQYNSIDREAVVHIYINKTVREGSR